MLLTQEAFDDLLAFLDPDRDVAAQKYEEVRRRLLRILTCRGCAIPEELVDECMDRVAAKATVLQEVYRGDRALYFYGVARRVLLEHFKKRRVPAPPSAPGPADDHERELECLERCMEALAPDQRRLITEYHRDEKAAKIERRKELAAQLGIGLGALRIRAHRIRARLLGCVKACLKRGGEPLESTPVGV